MIQVTLCNPQTDSVVTLAFVDYEDAFDSIETMVKMARNVPREKVPSLLPRLRDQVLLNFARWLTDGRFSDATRDVFIQLCARKERSTTATDMRLITAFGCADALTAAAVDGDSQAWPDFDAKLLQFRELFTRGAA